MTIVPQENLVNAKSVNELAQASATPTLSDYELFLRQITGTDEDLQNQRINALSFSLLVGLLGRQSDGALWAGTDDSTGDVRGENAVDIQASRTLSTEVASGIRCIAIGNGNTSSGTNSICIGRNSLSTGTNSTAIGSVATAGELQTLAIGATTTAADQYAIAIGNNNANALGQRSLAIGFGSGAKFDDTIAIGRSCVANGANTISIGRLINTNTINTLEIGYWLDSSTRQAALRIDLGGLTQKTIKITDAIPADGGAVDGAEAFGTMARGMAALRISTLGEVWLDWNDAGTVNSSQLS